MIRLNFNAMRADHRYAENGVFEEEGRGCGEISGICMFYQTNVAAGPVKNRFTYVPQL